MLFSYTYLLHHFENGIFQDPAVHDAAFIVPLEAVTTGDRAAIFQTLMRSDSRFCCYLSADLLQHPLLFIRDEIMQHLVRLLFLPNYARQNGQYIFFAEPAAAGNIAFDSLKDQLRSECNKQGLNINIETLPSNDSANAVETAATKSTFVAHPSLQQYLSAEDDTAGLKFFTESFNILQCVNKNLVIRVTDNADFKRKTSLLEAFEDWLASTQPVAVNLLQLYKGAAYTVDQLCLQNELLRSKLENSASYLQLIREESAGLLSNLAALKHDNHRLVQLVKADGSELPAMSLHADNPDFISLLQTQVAAQKKRADETLDWYLKEYEALPLWYKRGGQVIRVLTGKRTFASLFRNKES